MRLARTLRLSKYLPCLEWLRDFKMYLLGLPNDSIHVGSTHVGIIPKAMQDR